MITESFLEACSLKPQNPFCSGREETNECLVALRVSRRDYGISSRFAGPTAHAAHAAHEAGYNDAVSSERRNSEARKPENRQNFSAPNFRQNSEELGNVPGFMVSRYIIPVVSAWGKAPFKS
jgi:hypothetical protein